MTDAQSPDLRARAASVLAELHRSRRTTRQVWDGPRAAAETALVLGALRRRGTLDAILQAHSTRKLPLLKPETLASLGLGLRYRPRQNLLFELFWGGRLRHVSRRGNDIQNNGFHFQARASF